MAADARRPPEPAGVLELLVGGSRVPLRFVLVDGRIYVLASEGSANWVAAMLREGRASMTVEGQAVDGAARLVTNAERRAELIQRFLAEWPDGRRRGWFAEPGPLVEVEVGAAASPDAFGTWVRDTFDASAETYEQRLAANPVERRFRERSLALLRSSFRPGDRLVELGPGPGTETLPMLRLRHRIYAVDTSRAMLDRLERAASAQGTGSGLTARVGRASELGALTDGEAPGSFDGGYSTFGALNLEPNLRPLATALARLIRPGGRFVAGVAGRWALGEVTTFVLSGRWGELARRSSQPAPVGAHRYPVDVYYRSFEELVRTFAPEFRPREVHGLGIALPPPSFGPRLLGVGVDWARLDRLDRFLGERRPFQRLCDQLLLVLERGSEAVRPSDGSR